ncbi:hypothetical protein CC79DRAFT_1355301 [Sarocladium strictum]
MADHKQESLPLPPSYDDVTNSKSLARIDKRDKAIVGSTGGMHKFPESFNLYGSWSLSANWNGLWYLGPTKDEKLYTLATGKPLSKETPTLYKGPDTSGQIIGTVKVRDEQDVADVYIVVYPYKGSPLKQQLHLIMAGAYNLQHPFEVPVGRDGHMERFEWRNSRGEEVKDLNADRGGWKLVRMAGRNPHAQEPSKGFTSDGFEVVAVAAWNVTKSMTKGMKFSFIGRGATGEFGETWEVVVVLTFLQLYELDCMNTVNAAHPGRDPAKKNRLAGYDIGPM